MSAAGRRRGNSSGPRLSDPTAVDSVNPFDSTTARQDIPSQSAPPQTQLSDPPTALVRRESFRELPPGCVVGDNYEIDARLGAGAMGEVYAARHVRLGKRVAVKVIGQRVSEDPTAIERFAMEARTLAQIQHPAIVAVEHVGELADGRAFFVMEFLRGESLFARLQRGRLPLTEALRVLDQMARGLEAAHAEGVTHRDLKPENTFLVQLPGEPPAVKLLDFGLMKLAADRASEDRRAERTQSGVAIGTPMYMSPEQARGPNVDHRTDVYALGCIAYELLLGERPFPHARTAPELYAAHLHEAPPLPRAIWPEIPPQLDLVLFAMLAKDPAHRPTLAQIRSVLTAVRTASASQRAATEFVGPRAAGKQRRMWIASSVLVALVGGILIGAAAMRSSRDEVPDGNTQRPTIAPTPPPQADLEPAPSAPDAPPALPVKIESKPPVPQRIERSTDRHTARRSVPIVTSEPIADPPIDAGIFTHEGDDARPKTDADRNQTINPFAKKHPKAVP
jgi:serine/threonine-protein kinase